MDQIDTTCEHIRLRLIAAAVGLQQCTKTAANVIPLPGTERFIVIGTPAEVARLLPEMKAELEPQQISKLLFAADVLDGLGCEDTAGDLRNIARGAA